LSLDGESSDEEVNTNADKLRKQKIILVGILLIGLVSVLLLFFFKGDKKADEQAKIQAKLDAIDSLPKIVEPVATSTPEQVTITETPTGWLNVRSGPGTEYEKIDKLSPQETYILLEESEEWYKIKLSDEDEGWISSQYAQINN